LKLEPEIQTLFYPAMASFERYSFEKSGKRMGREQGEVRSEG
jgi:hypothetical protein